MKKSKGFYILIAAVLCGMIASSVGLCFNCVGVFFTPMADALGLKRGSIAMTSTINTFLSAIAAMIVPRILNRNNMKKIILSGIILSSGATLLYAASTELWQLYILSAVRGFGFGLYGMVFVTLIVNSWFESKNGLVTSIAMCFSGIFGAIGSPIFTSLISDFGWQKAYIVMGILIALVSTPALLVPFTLDPKDCGCLPYRDEKEVSAKAAMRFSKNGYNIVILLALVAIAFLTSGITSFTQHLPAVSEELGFSTYIGAMTISFALVGNMLSKLLIGIISDKFGPQISFLTLIAICMVGLLVIYFVPVPSLALAGAFLFGFVYGAAGIGVAFMTRFYVGMEQYGKKYSVIAAFGSVSSALMLSVIGYVYDFTGSYRPAMAMMIGFNAVAMFIAVMLIIRDKK